MMRLKVVTAAISKLVKFDMTTLKLERGKFAWLYIEVNLAMSMAQKVWIQDHWYVMEYKSLHLICSKYSCYGHVSRECKSH